MRTDLLGIVASARAVPEGPARGGRDLRFLGWDYEVRKAYNEGARVWSYYRLTKSAPWPDNIRAAITDEEKRRREVQKTAALDRLQALRRVVTDACRAALMARSISTPTAFATGGGKALPICR